MKYRFVLKDKGTSNQGWWLKISSIEELNSIDIKTRLFFCIKGRVMF